MANRFIIVAETLKTELAKPYVYGQADCFMLGIAMADALAGTDLRAEYQGCYSTLKGAQKALRKRGHTSLVTFFTDHLEPCAPAEAQLGDLVVIQAGGGEHVGICLGTRFVTKTEGGQQSFGLADCIAAFRTGAPA